FTEQMARHFDHDVIGGGTRILVVARQSLQARRAGRQDFDVAGEAVFAQALRAFLHLDLLAEAYLGRNVGPRNGERSGFAAAAIIFLDLLLTRRLDQGVDRLQRILLLHRRMTGVVVHVAHARDTL